MVSEYYVEVLKEKYEDNRLDAERYRKLREKMQGSPLHLGSVKRRGDLVFLEGRFDAAVDALPNPAQEG